MTVPLRFVALDTGAVRALWNDGCDAYGHSPERAVSSGAGVPCRHCLRQVEKGRPYLILAWRPFSTLQPYAETGPIFLHAEACSAADIRDELPEILESPDYILRGYDRDERIIYGTGAVVARTRILARARELLGDPDIAFLHVRSASNNCYQCRIERAGDA